MGVQKNHGPYQVCCQSVSIGSSWTNLRCLTLTYRTVHPKTKQNKQKTEKKKLYNIYMHFDLPPMIGVTKRYPTKVHLPTYPPTHLRTIWQSVSLSTTLRRRIVCHTTRRWTEPLIYIRKCIRNDAFGFGSTPSMAPLVVSWCRLFSSAIY